jgi:hypothetical protein
VAKTYLWLNAVIYVVFALWCTLSKEQTSLASGYLSLNNSGWSEYWVVYGGLQLGMAGFFAYLAMNEPLYRAGLVFSLFIYIAIVAYRLISLYLLWPVKPLTLGIAVLESLLLLGAAFSWSSLPK